MRRLAWALLMIGSLGCGHGGFRLQGRVVGRDGVPVEGAVASVVGCCEGEDQACSAQTRGDGAWELAFKVTESEDEDRSRYSCLFTISKDGYQRYSNLLNVCSGGPCDDGDYRMGVIFLDRGKPSRPPRRH